MKSVVFNRYNITKLDSETIEISKDGVVISPTKPMLRELAKELNISIYNANGNEYNTRQLGTLVIKEIKEIQSDNSLHNTIEDYISKNRHGIFHLYEDDKIRKVMKKNSVPNEYGVYIIYALKCTQEELIYIGKAGTIETDGSMKKQGIRDRLKAVTKNNMQRGLYFQQEVIKKYKLDSLKFLWIITFDKNKKELPTYSEAKLIQAYYDKYGRLPKLNVAF